jgi:hypothetical protein
MSFDLSAAGDRGRELACLLEGRRPLVLFYDDADDPAGSIPESAFAPFLENRTLVKGEEVLEVVDPVLSQRSRVRYVLYARSEEHWRIPAALLALQTRLKVNAMADEGLERLLCALLGYSEEETSACLEAQVLERC